MKTEANYTEITPDIIAEHGLKPEEYDRIVKLIGRTPNINELGMFSVMWSEHCCYKSSKKLLEQFPTCGEKIICGPGENAGVVDVGDDTYVVFKVESHNHPTAVEPFQGAATGVGGILRDIFTMGARPIANLNSLRFGELTDKHNRYLFSNAVAGIAWYGNCVGVPTVAGECWFDDTFSANPLVNAMTVGVLYDCNIIKSGAKGVGNSVIYVGSTTGRDGMAGAAFASKEITDESNKDRPAVQVGDPFMGKLLIEACLEAFKTGQVIACQDMGAAGLTCSIAEMASNGDVGIKLDLDLVPKRTDNITPYEFLLSESQERMLLVVEPEYELSICNIFKKWGLLAVKVGEVLSDKRIIVTHNKKEVVNIPAYSLTKEAPINDLTSSIPAQYNQNQNFCFDKIPDINSDEIEKTLCDLLASPNICSKEWVYSQYDRQVQNNSILHSSHNTSALIRLRDKSGKPSNKALAISMDCNSRYVYLDPYKGAILAVAEAARNIVATGAKPLAITNNLNFANPEKPENFWQLAEATKGIADACRAFNIYVTGGNVSLYNESNGIPIYPTPVIGMIGLIDDFTLAVTPEFKDDNDILILVGKTHNDLGGSEYLKIKHNIVNGKPPLLDLDNEKNIQNFCINVIAEKLLKSCCDISEGGLLVSICETAIKGCKGVKLSHSITSLCSRLDASLFGETSGRLLISVDYKHLDQIQQHLKQNCLQYNIIGKIQPDLIEIEENYLKTDIIKLKKIWKNSLSSLIN